MTDATAASGAREPGAVRFILGAPRSACRPAVLIPVWAAVAAAATVESWALTGAAWPARGAWIALALAAWGWASLVAVRDGARGDAVPLSPLLRGLPGRWIALLCALIGTAITPLLFVAVAVAVAAALPAWVPVVGRWLGLAWTATGGLVLALAAAAWTVLGVPAAFLQVPAAMAEFPHAYDLVSRTFDYVRRRPLLLAGGLAIGFLAALGVAAIASAVATLALAVLGATSSAALGVTPSPSRILDAAARVWSSPSVWWPIAWWPEPLVAPAPAWMVSFARLVPALLVAATTSAIARLYLVLRRAVDGTPLAGS